MIEFMKHLPALIAALCLTIYWAAVVVKLIKLARKIGKDPNALPRERVGQLLRIIWYPIVLLWIVEAWSAAVDTQGSLSARLPSLAWWLTPVVPANLPWALLAGIGSVVSIVCTVLTFICWRKMGRSWRIGIDPAERLEMVSTGPYRLVRHPIYALRICMGLWIIVMVPTPLMALTVAIDIILLQLEARREETYMETQHGAVYATYKKNVGRFVPRRIIG